MALDFPVGEDGLLLWQGVDILNQDSKVEISILLFSSVLVKFLVVLLRVKVW